MPTRTPFTEADARDTQALVKTGFGKLRGGCYLLLRIGDAAVPFSQDGTTITVPLPAFDREVTIEVR